MEWERERYPYLESSEPGQNCTGRLKPLVVDGSAGGGGGGGGGRGVGTRGLGDAAGTSTALGCRPARPVIVRQ